MSTALEDLSHLADRVTAEIAEAVRMPRMEAIRQALNETRIRSCRESVLAAPDRIAQAEAALRAATDVERDAKKRLADEELAADWELSERFPREGNKCFLVDPDGERRQVLADEWAARKAGAVAKVPAVAAAAVALRTAEHATAEARVAHTAAENRFSAIKADLTAAIAELGALRIGIASTTDREEAR